MASQLCSIPHYFTPEITLTMPDPHSHSSHCLRLPDSSCRPENSWLIPGKGATSWPELFLCPLPHLCLGGDPGVTCHLLARVQVGGVFHTKSKRWLLLRNYGLIFIRRRCYKLLRILQLPMHCLCGAIILAIFRAISARCWGKKRFWILQFEPKRASNLFL